jgi:hypothetical protein
MSKKLFHHLVYENEVRNEYKNMLAEAKKGFAERSKYEGMTRNYQPNEEDGDPIAPDRKELVTTVQDKLDYLKKYIVKLLDYEAVKDCTNADANAKADLVVDGVVIGENLPATLLLQLEKRLREIRDVYASAPTLDLSKEWKNTGEKYRYKLGPITTYKSEKKVVPVVLYEATKEHPAQVKESTKDLVVGTYETMYFTGAIHPRLKSEWLERLDILIESCKVARTEANEVDLVKSNIGTKLLEFVHKNDSSVLEGL